MTTKQKCSCITKSGYKECLDDFNCERCGMCMNWRGYEEGTIDCGCRIKGLEKCKAFMETYMGKLTDEEYLGILEAQRKNHYETLTG